MSVFINAPCKLRRMCILQLLGAVFYTWSSLLNCSLLFNFIGVLSGFFLSEKVVVKLSMQEF